MNNKNLIKNISFFTFFNVINSAIPFLLLPVLTVYLTPEDYGIIDIFFNISLIATPLVGLSIVQAISRYYFEDIDLPKFVATVLLVLIKIGVILIGLAILISFFADDLLESFDIPPFLLVVAVVYTLFSQICEIVLILWRVSYKTVNYGIFRVCKTLLDLGLSIVLIVSFNMGWSGRIIPQVLVAIAFGLLACFLLYKNGYLAHLKIHKEYKSKALSFSTPLIFHTLGGSIIGFSDRFFILVMLGLDNVGIYSVAYQIGMVIALVQNSFNQAWVPFFFEKLKENKFTEKLKIVKITYVYFVLMLVLAAAFYWVTPFIYTYFIGDAFNAGESVVLWVLLGYAFQGMYKMVVNYLFYLKKTKTIAYCTLFTMVLNLVLNYFMIEMNGINGAAQATLISFIALFIIVFITSKRNFEMPWGLKA